MNINTEQQNAWRKELQKQQKIYQKLEEEINKLKVEKAELEAKLADPAFYANKEELLKVDERYRQVSARFDSISKDGDKVFELVMELEEKLS